MTPARRKAWERYPFHSFDSTVTRFRADFDIDLVNGLSNERRRLGALAFNRRHLYEHKGGVVDQKYLDESGDTTVRLRQMLREDPEDVLEYSIIVSKMIENAHAGFHEIFPPHETPLSIKRR